MSPAVHGSVETRKVQVFVAEPAAFEPLFQQLRLCGFPGSVEPFENYQRHKDNYLPRLLPHPAGPPAKGPARR